MTSSEFALLSALCDHPHGEIVDVLVRDLHQNQGLNPNELTMILQAMCDTGSVRRSAGVFRLSRVEITGTGLIALEQRQQELDQLAEERADREISWENQKKSNVLDLFFKILSAIAGFFAFLL